MNVVRLAATSNFRTQRFHVDLLVANSKIGLNSADLWDFDTMAQGPVRSQNLVHRQKTVSLRKPDNAQPPALGRSP
jgi:hypothetical protein